MGRSLDIDDPLTLAIAPPADETPEARAARLQHEEDARRVNDQIDEMLHQERTALRRRRKPVKVLLLGQSESGKSTTLKNFQLTYARKAWQEERLSWRAIVQLNLVRSVTTILDLLHAELTGSPLPLTAPFTSLAGTVGVGSNDDDPALQDAEVREEKFPRLNFTEKHRLLKLKLAPLRKVQADLERRLGNGAEEPTPFEGSSALSSIASPFDTVSSSMIASPYSPSASPPRRQEFYVRSSTGWKSALDKLRPSRSSTSSREGQDGARERREAEETTQIIAGCRDDMKSLWEDKIIHEMLTRRKLRLEESGGFFLNDVERVAITDYEPSDDDIVRARLRTMGVQEYRFLFERGSESGHEWLMYDVGGTRSLRAAWAPFFDDVNAIIFLAPISAFDEKLAENPRVNRLEDSFLLWKAVVSNKLLSKTQIILFLNKCDLLERKLSEGRRVRDYVPSFAERRNEVGVVAKYFRQKFQDMQKQYSPEPRPFYVHLTSVIDTKATAITLGAVREGILREHLRGADFL